MKITLTNNFHDTSVTLRPRDGKLSAAQVRRAKRTLCGMAECTCSDDLGRRGPQPDADPDPEDAYPLWALEERADGSYDVIQLACIVDWSEEGHCD